MKNSIVYLLLAMIVLSCQGERITTPKPRSFPKVDYPEKTYTAFDNARCNFTFEIPTYTKVKQEKKFFEEETESKCWFDISYSHFNGNLHCSYYDIKDRAHFDKLVNDAFKFVSKHQKKVNTQNEYLVRNEDKRVYGLSFEMDGPVASPMQFYLTDSTRHFLRASLYFNNKVNVDSMAPIHAFVKEDVKRMIQTFDWGPL